MTLRPCIHTSDVEIFMNCCSLCESRAMFFLARLTSEMKFDSALLKKLEFYMRQATVSLKTICSRFATLPGKGLKDY